jgi:Ni/Co efflux regulator RcnB
MKSNVLLAAALALTLGAGTAAFAEGPDWDGVGYPGTPAQQRQWEYQRQQREQLESQSRTQGPQYNQQWQQYGAPARHGQYERNRQGGYGPSQQHGQWDHRGDARRDHRFQRGEYLPSHEWRQAHSVHDWRARRLYAPAPGYGWVQADTGDYLLVALATGLIANILIAQ